MTPEFAVELLRSALYLTIVLVVAIILPGLLVGLVVAVFQAATSVNEQTLSFLPRLVMTLLTLMALGHWFMDQLMTFTTELVRSIPSVLG
ncbi:flagellar biosynthesis protein FliQ [Permianibacter sp. IMCC34836]|uniref:flagellar biosynthesis protein FliQ n=1 Tax=Permianibacter fluminis TaxID=2738515 RepID=UPI001553692D|nr:flagellar biosynthesis protein FliQ [Permianibacter fluminis]NQD38025.1 flagellar biosynthesis protein FliQ [Permianibacter fluminis]